MLKEDGLGPTTDVTVHISGRVVLPLHLEALETLEDPALQDEIMQEAVRLAIAEKLGGFDNMSITATPKGGRPVCEARLQFADLCCAIADVQHAYKHAMVQMLRMQEMVTAALQHEKDGKEEEEVSEKRSQMACEKNAEVLSTLAKVLEETLEFPGESSLSAAIRTRMPGNNDNADDAAEGSYEEYRNPKDEGYMPLLDNQQLESDDGGDKE